MSMESLEEACTWTEWWIFDFDGRLCGNLILGSKIEYSQSMESLEEGFEEASCL